MPNPREASKCRKWEKERRGRINDCFTKLGKILPCYNPSTNLSKIEILNKAASYIEELEVKVKDVLTADTENKAEHAEIKQLYLRVKQLLTRNEQLTNLLKDASISIPSECGTIKGFKNKKWANIITKENAEAIAKQEAQKENEPKKIKTRKKSPKKGKIIQKAKGLVQTKHKKNIIADKINPIKNNGTIIIQPNNNVSSMQNLVTIANVQPCYLITNTPANSIAINASSGITAITSSNITNTNNQIISTNTTSTVFKSKQNTFSPATIIFTNNLPMAPQPNIINPPIFLNTAQTNTLIVVPNKNQTTTTISTIKCNTVTKTVSTFRPIVTKTTHVNKVPIPSSRYASNYVILSQQNQLNHQQGVIIKSPKKFASKKVIKTNKLVEVKKRIKVGVKRTLTNSKDDQVDKKKSKKNEKDSDGIKDVVNVNENTKNVSSDYSIDALCKDKPTSEAIVTDKNIDISDTVIVCAPTVGTTNTVTSQPNYNTENTNIITSSIQSIPNFSLVSESLPNVETSIVTKTITTQQENISKQLPFKELIPTKTLEIQTHDITNALDHSELSNDIFASLQVPSGSQNPESTSPTAAFLLAFPLVSSLTGAKVTEVIEDETSDSHNGTPTLLQIGTMDTTKPTQTHSDSLTPSLLNLDNFTFFSSKEMCNSVYTSFDNIPVNTSGPITSILPVSSMLPSKENVKAAKIIYEHPLVSMQNQIYNDMIKGTSRSNRYDNKVGTEYGIVPLPNKLSELGKCNADLSYQVPGGSIVSGNKRTKSDSSVGSKQINTCVPQTSLNSGLIHSGQNNSEINKNIKVLSDNSLLPIRNQDNSKVIYDKVFIPTEKVNNKPTSDELVKENIGTTVAKDHRIIPHPNQLRNDHAKAVYEHALVSIDGTKMVYDHPITSHVTKDGSKLLHNTPEQFSKTIYYNEMPMNISDTSYIYGQSVTSVQEHTIKNNFTPTSQIVRSSNVVGSVDKDVLTASKPSLKNTDHSKFENIGISGLSHMPLEIQTASKSAQISSEVSAIYQNVSLPNQINYKANMKELNQRLNEYVPVSIDANRKPKIGTTVIDKMMFENQAPASTNSKIVYDEKRDCSKVAYDNRLPTKKEHCPKTNIQSKTINSNSSTVVKHSNQGTTEKVQSFGNQGTTEKMQNLSQSFYAKPHGIPHTSDALPTIPSALSKPSALPTYMPSVSNHASTFLKSTPLSHATSFNNTQPSSVLHSVGTLSTIPVVSNHQAIITNDTTTLASAGSNLSTHMSSKNTFSNVSNIQHATNTVPALRNIPSGHKISSINNPTTAVTKALTTPIMSNVPFSMSNLQATNTAIAKPVCVPNAVVNKFAIPSLPTTQLAPTSSSVTNLPISNQPANIANASNSMELNYQIDKSKQTEKLICGRYPNSNKSYPIPEYNTFNPFTDIPKTTAVSVCTYNVPTKSYNESLYTNNCNFNYQSEFNANYSVKHLGKVDKYYGTNYETYVDYNKDQNAMQYGGNYYNSQIIDKTKYPNQIKTNKGLESTHRPTVNWMTTPDLKPLTQTEFKAQPEFKQADFKHPDFVVAPFAKEPDFATNLYSQNSFVSNAQTTYFTTTAPIYPASDFSTTFTDTRKVDSFAPNAFQRNEVDEQQFSWSPTKIPQLLDPSHNYVSTTLPTLVGDLALGTTQLNYNTEKMKGKTKERRLNQQSYDTQQTNFLSVSQLVDHNVKETPSRVTSRRNSGGRAKTTSSKANKRSPKGECKDTILSPNYNKVHPEKNANKQLPSTNFGVTPDATDWIADTKRQIIKNPPSSYSAEALIGHPTHSNVISKTRTSQSSYVAKTIPVPTFLPDNILPYFPPVELQQDNFAQQNQNFQNQSFAHSFSSTIASNTYPSSTFIPNPSTITTTYIPAGNFIPEIGEYNPAIPENIFSHNNTKVADKQFNKTTKTNDKRVAQYNTTPKKSKKKTSNEAVPGFVDFSFLSMPGTVNSPILPDDFHAHSNFLPPPTPNQLYSCKNPLYPKQSGDLSGGLLPLPSVTRSTIQHPQISPSLNTIGTSLTNFNLSTIFPEINKGNVPDMYLDSTKNKDFGIQRCYLPTLNPNLISTTKSSYSSMSTTQSFSNN